MVHLARGQSPREHYRLMPAGHVQQAAASEEIRGDQMQIELSQDDAVTLRDLLRHKVDKQINRTDSIAFKQELQQLDRTIERVPGEVSTALAEVPTALANVPIE
jgi:hypothetical protein